MIFPRQLQKGDTILLIAPSSPLLSITARDCADGLEQLGYKVRIAPSCTAETARGYAAASPEMRAKDINEGFADDSVNAIWAVRGGSMAAEVLPLLDLDLIRKHPKPLIGFSDITALHITLQEKCGMVSFHAPCASTFAIGKEPNEYAKTRFDLAMNMGESMEFENLEGTPIRTICGGSACGELVGGNLTLVMSLLGSPYQLSTKGRILFLEDVEEDVYRLNRMLISLKLSGMLDDAAGILLGDFTDCNNGYNVDYTADRLMEDFFADFGKPVYAGLTVGHIGPNGALPLGTHCEMKNGRIILHR